MDGWVTIKGRRYPSQYAPGKGGADLDDAWRLLDALNPDAISDEARAFLAGGIVALVMKARSRQ